MRLESGISKTARDRKTANDELKRTYSACGKSNNANSMIARNPQKGTDIKHGALTTDGKLNSHLYAIIW